MIYATNNYIRNPFTKYQDWFEIINKLNNWEYRLIENKRLWELLEYEAKIREMEKIMQSKQYYNNCTISN